MTRSKDNRHKYHEIGHLVRYLSISHYWHKPAEEIYTLQKIFPNIKYLYFAIAPLHSNDFGSMTNWSLWGSLTELHMTINGSYKPIMEDSLVEAITCLPLLRYLDIHGQMQYSCKISFSVNSFEIIHSHLKHLEYMKLSTSFLTLSDTDFEHLTGIENSLCNLVKVNINIPTIADIDTFLRAAPRLKSLKLLQADIKVKDDLYNSERFELQSFDLSHSTITSDVLRFLSFHCRNFDTLNMNYTSVYGSFTTPGCQLIDMTYGRFETVSLENTSFFIKDNKKCPENRNVTLITRQVDGIPPKQEYDPNSLPVDIGETSDKDHYEWIYQYPAHDFMDEISEEQASFITKFVSNYEENKKLTLDKALDTKIVLLNAFEIVIRPGLLQFPERK
ncbi:hypothetical protein CLU79DRAFT_841876 [Phycomyces nitens]|nr:hypothetical protein CLU79DRAFT_841876 [Phycomyces nitens]